MLNIDYDQSAARRMGLSRQDIAVSMLSAAGGIPVGAFYEGTHKNTIYLKCTEADGKPVDNLENVPVFPMMPDLAGLSTRSCSSNSNRERSTAASCWNPSCIPCR